MQLDIHNVHNERLDCAWHGPEDATHVVVIGHGVTANKDRDWARELAGKIEERLGSEGVGAVRFSFSGNGESEGEFGDSTISKEVADLGAVLDALDGKQLAYVGHSMGAAVGVLAAALDARIRWLVSLAGMVHTDEFARRKFGDLVPDAPGALMWDKPECPLSSRFIDDMRDVGTTLSEAERIEVPWLLLHGSDDSVVPIADTLDVLQRVRGDLRFVELPDCDHVFSGEACGRMASEVSEWLAGRLL